MKIIINENVFNITSRLKQINPNFFIMYNLNTKKFELHDNNYGALSYILSFPYNTLDGRAIDYVKKNFNKEIDYDEVDKYNKKINDKKIEKLKSENDYKLTKYFDYANKKSNIASGCFDNIWT